MTYDTIQAACDKQGILTITLNRPDILNAFNVKMMHELVAAFDAADEDDDVRAIIVTGAGRGFCAGADLSSGADTFDYQKRQDRADRAPKKTTEGKIDYSAEQTRDGGGRVSLRIYDCLKPVIGAINGPAVGVGVTMQLPMDRRIASDKARFGFVFTQRGIVPEACSSWFLPRLVGINQALDWCYSGRVFEAQEALKAGLVQQVVSHDQLMDAARAQALAWIASSAPVSVALSRQMMWQGLGQDHPMEAHKMDSRAIYARGRQDDPKEGVQSFLEKRSATFRDKVSRNMPEVFPFAPPRQYS